MKNVATVQEDGQGFPNWLNQVYFVVTCKMIKGLSSTLRYNCFALIWHYLCLNVVAENRGRDCRNAKFIFNSADFRCSVPPEWESNHLMEKWDREAVLSCLQFLISGRLIESTPANINLDVRSAFESSQDQ